MVKGDLKDFKAFIDRDIRQVRSGALSAVRTATRNIRDEARATVPKDTKTLQKSIKSTAKEGKGSVHTDVEYAGLVEYGTFKKMAHPYLRPAADKFTYPFIAEMRDVVERGSVPNMAKLAALKRKSAMAKKAARQKANKAVK